MVEQTGRVEAKVAPASGPAGMNRDAAARPDLMLEDRGVKSEHVMTVKLVSPPRGFRLDLICCPGKRRLSVTMETVARAKRRTHLATARA